MRHKLVVAFNDYLEKKEWLLACGKPWGIEKITKDWRSVQCPECKKHRKRRKTKSYV